MILPSSLGHPVISLFVKRGIFNKFLLDKNANVAIKAKKESTSIKEITNV